MQLDWTTFVLEILNFLILLWILKRFLYEPVLKAITRRKAAIEQTLEDASKQKTEAQALEQQYRTRLDAWEQEKAKLREQMLGEIRAERERQLAELQKTLANEREKNHVLEERRLRDLEHKLRDEVRSDAVRFLSRLMQRLATPALETRMVDVAVEDLKGLPDAQRQQVKDTIAEDGAPAKVSTAFPLSAEQRKEIEQALGKILGRAVKADYVRDETLLAGLKIQMGPWTLQASLQDEMKFFAQADHDGNAH